MSDAGVQGSVSITFKAGSVLTTRTAVTSSENLQHVQQVYLYIFRGISDESLCLASEDVNWKQPVGATTRQTYTIRTKLPPGTYTLLAVGLDDESGFTYNLPNSIKPSMTLAEAKASLTDGKTKEDMLKSELFAGYTTVVLQNGGNVSTNIDLWRRVVGVLGYFKHIPYEINGIRVANLQVRLYKNQHNNIVLRKPETEDYGSGVLVDSQCLIDFRLSGYQKSTKGNFYAIPSQNGNGLFTVENSLLKGAYLLPVKAQSGQTTLQVVLLDETGSILRTYNVKQNISSIYDYSLESNQFYSMGINNNSNTIDDDRPIDLLQNNDIVITVDPNWENSFDLNLQ